MIRKRKHILSPYHFDSADDYYAQFVDEETGRDEQEDIDDNFDPDASDQDCEYWQRVMRDF